MRTGSSIAAVATGSLLGVFLALQAATLILRITAGPTPISSALQVVAVLIGLLGAALLIGWLWMTPYRKAISNLRMDRPHATVILGCRLPSTRFGAFATTEMKVPGGSFFGVVSEHGEIEFIQIKPTLRVVARIPTKDIARLKAGQVISYRRTGAALTASFNDPTQNPPFSFGVAASRWPYFFLERETDLESTSRALVNSEPLA